VWIFSERGEYGEEPAGARLSLVDVKPISTVTEQSRFTAELLHVTSHTHTAHTRVNAVRRRVGEPCHC